MSGWDSSASWSSDSGASSVFEVCQLFGFVTFLERLFSELDGTKQDGEKSPRSSAGSDRTSRRQGLRKVGQSCETFLWCFCLKGVKCGPLFSSDALSTNKSPLSKSCFLNDTSFITSSEVRRLLPSTAGCV